VRPFMDECGACALGEMASALVLAVDVHVSDGGHAGTGGADECDITRRSRVQVRQRSVNRIRERVTIGPMRFVLLRVATVSPALMSGA